MNSALHTPSGYSLIFDRALMVASLVHARQKRKGGEVPYITHPVHVAMILARHGFPERLLVAAVLHDVLEDIRPEDEELQAALRETFPAAFREAREEPEEFLAAVERFLDAEFRPDVMGLVRSLTDQKKRPDGSRIPAAESKRLARERLSQPDVPEEVIVIKCADALHNARQVVADLQAHGLPMMKRFNTTPDETLRHYAGVWKLATRRFGDAHPLAHELGHAVQEMARTLDEQFVSAHEQVRQAMREMGRPGRTTA